MVYFAIVRERMVIIFVLCFRARPSHILGVLRYRNVSVREDVYQRLAGLDNLSKRSMSVLIEELLDNYESGVRYSGVVVKLGGIETILRGCLGKLSTRV